MVDGLSINIHNPTFTDIGTVYGGAGTINGGTNVFTSRKRDREKEDDHEEQTKTSERSITPENEENKEDDMTSPSTKKSRISYGSSSEMERLSSLANDSIFDNDDSEILTSPSTKKSRISYGSSSEMERLSSLANDSIFDNDDSEIPPGSAEEVSPGFVENESQGILESDNDPVLELYSPEVKSLQPDEVLLRKTLIEILNKYKTKDHPLGKTFMDSSFLNNIIDLTDNETKHGIQSTLNLDQKLYIDKVLEKHAWIPTLEFKNYCDQFTEDVCNRAKIPTLAPDSKETKDDVKLARNATRILNKLLDSVPCKKARVYTIQCVNGHIHIRYMVRPLPSVYLYDEFACIKIPTSFDDMEQFAIDMKILMDLQSDVLKTVKSVNKPVKCENVYKSEVEITPKK
ncbi:hypothetical protein C1646_674631 [Rhizophagus diaphanus]|nr:hypothetical protein C1646_674631 [Rhizophagus diaphanus] [Rhizophagus sp. MUCL 43196]